MSDVLAAVVGMHAQDCEGEGGEHFLQNGQQVSLGDLLARGHDFPLGNAVHGVDVIDALGAILIALMHAVDSDKACPPLGSRGASYADGGALDRKSTRLNSSH